MSKLLTALLASGGIAFATIAGAQTMTKQAYDAEIDKIEAAYKAEKERCDALSGNQKDICQAQAKGSGTSARPISRLRSRTPPTRGATRC